MLLYRKEDREVWLEGEAFFSVTHQMHDQKFLVHTPEALRVEVLGADTSAKIQHTIFMGLVQ